VVDPFNYVTRVKTPLLMLNGVYDTNLTLKEEVEPMFRLLGTPEKDKKLILYQTDHFIPRSELIKETLGWFDKYLGPVR
jgi:dipeptidyl aminopeptidase/acylaminoacyl peptidase